MKFLRVFTLVLFCGLLAGLLCSAPARANSLLISPNPNPAEHFPMQGDCARNGINTADPNIDLTRATWACTGASQQMVRIFYREGPEECVYIDNFNNDGGELRAFFVPLQTSDEWAAFAANLPGGVRLRYGCPGGVRKDPCGNEFVLPDMPASDNPNDIVHILTQGDYQAQFACPAIGQGTDGQMLNTGCGEWQQVKESGNCGLTHTEPTGPGTPPIPVPGTTGASSTGGDTTAILPIGPGTSPISLF